jgi:hypothetical protein
MELGTIQNPTVIHEDKAGGYRILAWEQTKAFLPDFEPQRQLIVTSELFDPDPDDGGWATDDFMEFGTVEAGAARAAIDAFLGPLPCYEVAHNAKHCFTEGDSSLLIEPIYDVSRDGYPVKKWELTDEYGETIRITPTRLMWLAMIAPKLLAAYNAAQKTEEVGNA